MSIPLHTHTMLLALQLASVFKYVNDAGYHRESYKTFSSLSSESGPSIIFTYTEHQKKGRSSVDVQLTTPQNRFNFRQWFNYGILLELEVQHVNTQGTAGSLLELMLDAGEGDTALQSTLFDFEYAISIFTEHVSHILAKK